MKSIEEIAEAYGKEKPFTWTDADGELNKDVYSPAIAYEDGAKAVINEIEMELSALTFEDYVIHSQRCKKVIEEIYLKVQELKGQK